VKLYQLKTLEKLTISKKTSWKFFSNPTNLFKITPPRLSFEIRTELSAKMYAGIIITYFAHPVVPFGFLGQILN